MKTASRFGLAGLLPAIILVVVVFLPGPLFAADNSHPSQVTLDAIDGPYTPVVFDHELHEMVADGCGTCHHHAGSGETDTCLHCHTIGKNAFRQSIASMFIPCRMCHGKIDPEHPSLPDLKAAYHTQCFSCHRGSGGLGEGPQGCVSSCHERKDKP